MGNRFLKWASALSAVALVSGVLAISANAHIGASHSPFTTDRPDLVSAEITGGEVLYCFDEEVSEVFSSTDFFVEGYDENTEAQGDDVDLATDENCVTVEFDDDRALEDFTIAGVYEGAVEDRADNENIEATVALEGSTRGTDTEGDTEHPDLIDYEVNEQDDQITYVFDEDIDESCGTGDPGSDYGYYTDDGESGGRNTGTLIDDCDGNEVTVNFTNVDDVQRVFVDQDGAGSAPCTDSPSNWCTEYQGIGGNTNDADLEDVERTDDNEWTFHFDEDVENPDIGNFYLVTDGGESYTADSCDVDNDTDVQCDFDDLENAEDHEVVLGAVDECAVDTDDLDNDCNTVGSAPIGESAGDSGFTTGPDLETCELDVANETATFFFDETIDEDSTTAGSFHLFDDQGNYDDGNDIDDSDEEGGSIVIDFDQDSLEDAVGCSVEDQVISDLTGDNWNPLAAVGADTESPTTATTGSTVTSISTSTSTSTVTTGTTTPPRTIRVATNLTIRYDRSDRAFKGSVGSARKRCQVGRKVTLHKRGAGIKGRDTSNRRGNWKVNKRARRGRWFAKVTKKVFTDRRGNTIICRPDESVTIKLGRRR